MVRARYGVAGDPIEHSLSPLLHSIVVDHLRNLDTKPGVIPDIQRVEIIPATGVEDALAWGYAGAVPNPPDWQKTSAPLGRFRSNELIKRALEASRVLSSSLPEGPDIPVADHQMPIGSEEVWMSLTTPLKHQLNSAVMRSIDASMAITSVNTLCWDGDAWWCASTDGDGLVMVAKTFAIDIENTVLGIIGGGGTARSIAEAWSRAGGKVNPLGGRRPLEESEYWTLSSEGADLVMDLDVSPGEKSDDTDICATYQPMNGDFEERLERLMNKPIDGRWMLCAQHLIAWAKLWSPNHAKHLPSLGLLLTRLVHAEAMLDSM